jgi:hypothetical protein
VKLDLTVHTALDELRMQMLGTQVLFGFQFQGVFQDGFKSMPRAIQLIDLSVLGLLVLTLGFLVAPAAQHRLVERGVATRRLFNTASRFAELALATYALAIGIDVLVITNAYWGDLPAGVAGILAVVVAISLWFGLGLTVKGPERKETMPNRKEPELHEKIDQMLTESRVILPGAQALLGFQFVVTMTKAFHDLPGAVQTTHFIALGAVLIAVMLLIAPAAVHRLGFGGQDAERMHDIGSNLITIALVPLAAGIAMDVYVALAKVISGEIPLAGGLVSFSVLALLWYGVPLAIRARKSRDCA